MTHRVSVIVPAFNAEATLAQTLASIRAQTVPPAEVIVVDDGSTDGTALLADSSGIARVMKQPNKGVAAAINTGLAAATGDVIAFLDADDLWPVDALQLQLAAMASQTGSAAVVGCFEEFVCPSLPPQDAARLSPRPRQTGWLAASTLLPRSVFAQHGLFNESLRLAVWIDWFGRARRAGLHVATHDGLVLLRRLRPGTLSSQTDNMKRDLLQIAKAALAHRRVEHCA